MRGGEPVDNSELVKFAQLFNDELTLDNLERIHLVNLCRFVGITPFGTDEFLRVRLRARLAAIKVGTPKPYTMYPIPYTFRHRRVPARAAASAPRRHQGWHTLT